MEKIFSALYRHHVLSLAPACAALNPSNPTTGIPITSYISHVITD
jgi:hypothetical protein